MRTYERTHRWINFQIDSRRAPYTLWLLTGRRHGELDPALICQFNNRVLKGLDVEDHVRPGEFRRQSVGVGSYRGAPFKDCPYIVRRMCQWLNTETGLWRKHPPSSPFAFSHQPASHEAEHVAARGPYAIHRLKTTKNEPESTMAAGMVKTHAAAILYRV